MADTILRKAAKPIPLRWSSICGKPGTCEICEVILQV